MFQSHSESQFHKLVLWI